MAVKTYLTVRPLRWDGRWVTPKHLLANSFTGMDVSFQQLVWRPELDGRMLLELVADTDEHLDAVVEAMTWYGKHQKTLVSAQAFAEEITGQAWTLTGDPAAERCDAAEGIAPPQPA
jgi:hypothetical protein